MYPIVHAENRLQTALNDLERTGSLQQQNIMDIETLLNPPDESVIIDNATDNEIYQAVMDAQWAQDACLISGGDDVNNNDMMAEPLPTRREVLQAALLINTYLNQEDGPLTQKLDTLLDSFKCDLCLQESRVLSSTHITDYFTSSASG